MIVVVVLIAWVAVGVAVGLFEARRGHWSKLAVLTGVLGPLAIPLAAGWHRRPPAFEPRTLRAGTALPGDLDVLVGVDGSPESLAAVRTSVALLGDRLRRLTLATVLDIETATHDVEAALAPGPWEEEATAERRLDELADELAPRIDGSPETVILAGNPAEALESFALERDYDLIVAGPRGRGMSKVVFGSCASRLAERERIPVLFVTSSTRLAEVTGATDGDR